MKVELWLIGKTKEPWAIQAMETYAKKCRRFCTLSITDMSASRHKEAGAIRIDETTRIVAALQKASRAFTILLDERGRELRSMAFADCISGIQVQGYSTIRFIIGGAYGVGDPLRQQVDDVLSFSQMTYPHQMIRVILLEQLYRAFTILRGEDYHHD